MDRKKIVTIILVVVGILLLIGAFVFATSRTKLLSPIPEEELYKERVIIISPMPTPTSEFSLTVSPTKEASSTPTVKPTAPKTSPTVSPTPKNTSTPTPTKTASASATKSP